MTTGKNTALTIHWLPETSGFKENTIQDPEDNWGQFAQLSLHWHHLHVLYAMLHGFISILHSVLNF